MKTSCEIIKDLLPLYHDNVCSENSRALVDEHLEECDSCRQLLESISNEISHTVSMENEARPLKAIQVIWKRKLVRSFLKGALITLLIFAASFGGYWVLTQERFIVVPAVQIDLEAYQLADGRIAWFSKAERNSFSIRVNTDYENNAYHWILMRAIINLDAKKRDWEEYAAEYGKYAVFSVFDPVELKEQYQQFGTIITSFYLGSIGNGVLVWEEGIKLPPASEELERYIKERDERRKEALLQQFNINT